MPYRKRVKFSSTGDLARDCGRVEVVRDPNWQRVISPAYDFQKIEEGLWYDKAMLKWKPWTICLGNCTDMVVSTEPVVQSSLKDETSSCCNGCACKRLRGLNHVIQLTTLCS
jgi:hypothetical protein